MFQFILGSADAAVERFVFSVWETSTAALMPAVTSLSIIFVALAGYLLWSGRIEMTRSEAASRLLRLALVMVFLANVAVLERFFFRLTTDVPEAVATTLVQSLGETDREINGSLDDIFVQGVETGGRVLDRW
jgi:hypothetical protein